MSKEVICSNCEKTFIKELSQCRSLNNFCSRSCSVTFNNKKRIRKEKLQETFEIEIDKKDSENLKLLKEKRARSKLKYEEIFKEGSSCKTNTLRRHILKDNLLKYECVFCGNIGEWNGKKLTLQIDHINGVNTDNRIINLRFLCPNCHSQTETFGSKNISKVRITFLCEDCGINPASKKSDKCNKCLAQIEEDMFQSEKRVIKDLLNNKKSHTEIAHILGITRASVYRKIKEYEF